MNLFIQNAHFFSPSPLVRRTLVVGHECLHNYRYKSSGKWGLRFRPSLIMTRNFTQMTQEPYINDLPGVRGDARGDQGKQKEAGWVRKTGGFPGLAGRGDGRGDRGKQEEAEVGGEDWGIPGLARGRPGGPGMAGSP